MDLRIVFTKGPSEDAIGVRAGEREIARFNFPKKGPIPHDGVHLIVEQEMGFRRGFWGLIAAGAAPGDIQQMAKAGGHASASRAQTPSAEIVELLQAERLVECFEADLWGAPTDCETFRGVLAAGCAASFVPAPVLDDAKIAAIRARITVFASAWRAAAVGGRLELRFAVGESAQ
jgi:hypothetical protein